LGTRGVCVLVTQLQDGMFNHLWPRGRNRDSVSWLGGSCYHQDDFASSDSTNDGGGSRGDRKTYTSKGKKCSTKESADCLGKNPDAFRGESCEGRTMGEAEKCRGDTRTGKGTRISNQRKTPDGRLLKKRVWLPIKISDR